MEPSAGAAGPNAGDGPEDASAGGANGGATTAKRPRRHAPSPPAQTAAGGAGGGPGAGGDGSEADEEGAGGSQSAGQVEGDAPPDDDALADCRVCGALLPRAGGAQPVVTCQRSYRYANRHRFCLIHLRADSFLLEGATVRFCQKCSRVQPISEFSAVNRTCKQKLSAHNARSRERYAAGEGNKKKRVRVGWARSPPAAEDDVERRFGEALAAATAVQPAMGWPAPARRAMPDPMQASHDFSAQLQLLSGGFNAHALLPGAWPAAGNADQIMQLLLSQGGQGQSIHQAWAVQAQQQAAAAQQQAAQLHAANPYAALGAAMGGLPGGTHALLQQAYAQMPAANLAAAGWQQQAAAGLAGGWPPHALTDLFAPPPPPAP